MEYVSIWVFHHSVPHTYIIWTWQISNCLIGAYLFSVMIYVYKGIFFFSVSQFYLCSTISCYDLLILPVYEPFTFLLNHIVLNEFHFPVSFSVPYQLSLKFCFPSLCVLKNVSIKETGGLSVNISTRLWICDGTIHFTDLSQPQRSIPCILYSKFVEAFSHFLVPNSVIFV